MTSKEIIALLEGAIEANSADSFRRGNVINLPASGEVIMTGDLHGNIRNFEKICRFAQLESNPQRHLILHELLHCTENQVRADQCHSYQLVGQVARLKQKFPDRVHILLGNHEMAQVTGGEVLKNGQPMVRSLNAGILATYCENGTIVMDFLKDFILSLPLVARTENRLWLSHSLPTMRHLDNFDNSIFDKVLTLQDMKDNLSLHALAWDRRHGLKCLEKLSEMWDADIFVVGHQPQAQGCAHEHPQLIILASDHVHGCILPIDLEKKYEAEQLFSLIKPLASIP
jgi:hypothetical protein